MAVGHSMTRAGITIIIFLSSLLPAPFNTTAEQLTDTHSFTPVYRIPLRIHLTRSKRLPENWTPILQEINMIWLSQAGICFEMHTVSHDKILSNGLDLWFDATIPHWNGYYRDEHDIHVLDTPDLNPADRPARSPAARTAAHELGHALNLSHNQNSDDNLMRSKTYGWQLHPHEVEIARQNARIIALADLAPVQCSSIEIHNDE